MKSNITLESLLTQAPYITIQGLFQENSLEEITGINKFLQENIRTQGIGLKKVFESKYMDLVNCSELLEKVYEFAGRIDKLAGEIKEAVKVREEDGSSVRKGEDKLVQKIESLVRKNQFQEAVRQCLASKQREPVLFEVVLLETVENVMHKALAKISKQTLFDLIQAISLFLSHEGETYLAEEDIEQEYGSSIHILSKHYKRMKGQSPRLYLLASINSLFEVKIKEARIDKHGSEFSHFVEDLLLMIQIIEDGFDRICQWSTETSKE